MTTIESTPGGWRLTGAQLELDIDRQTGCLAGLTIRRDKSQVWAPYAGDVTVRDDRLERTFDKRCLERVAFEPGADRLTIRKWFRGAPWRLEEVWRFEKDALAWEAAVMLDAGDYRSCAVTFHVPWPQPLYPVSFWAAKDNMPSAPHRYANIALEYGEVTSGILIPALSCYRADTNDGLLLAMPFDFRTPRFRFVSAYREPDLRAEFDWLALAPGKPARTSLLLRGTGGDWRPALGWLYERFTEYFEPRSDLIHALWGGHISGTFDVSSEDARGMASLGMKWHEVHAHFPAYGNYHPEGMKSWRSGHERTNEKLVDVEMVRRTIANLRAMGIAALPYIQVTGDADASLLNPAMEGSRIRNLQGELCSAWPGTYLMNADPSLPFGKDITRQIEGMVNRYPEMDGVFVDQAGYNFLDTAHDDGITAVNNRPAYMTGFSYFPHLEHLSRLLHPAKTMIANAPFGVGSMKYFDAFMAEGSGWLCDHLQYYGIGSKPMFFLEYDTSDQRIERMFQNCLVHAAGFTSYPGASGSKDLFDLYRPVLHRLYRRRWVFDAEPLQLPTAFKGNVFRGANGSLLVSMVKGMTAIPGRALRDSTVGVRTGDIDNVKQVTLQQVGGAIEPIPFRKDNGGIQFDVAAGTVAAVAELHMEPL